MKKINIQVAANVDIPREENPRQHLKAGQKYEVNDSVYYRRRIGDGDAILLSPKNAAKASVKKGENTNGQS